VGRTPVIVADDNLLIREGLRTMIEACDELDLVAVAADYPSLLEAVSHCDQAVVLTDIRMPPTHTDEGIRAATFLRRNRPDIGVVVLSQYVNSTFARALLEEGSQGRGYLLKERVLAPVQLVAAVVSVAAGGSVVDPAVIDRLVGKLRGDRSPLRALTAREIETLQLVAEGKTNAAIARTLFVSERAVEKHINSIFMKLGLCEDGEVHRRVQATLMYLTGD
jgi:DNA-binding NarL/FixJ family response regulator